MRARGARRCVASATQRLEPKPNRRRRRCRRRSRPSSAPQPPQRTHIATLGGTLARCACARLVLRAPVLAHMCPTSARVAHMCAARATSTAVLRPAAGAHACVARALRRVQTASAPVHLSAVRARQRASGRADRAARRLARSSARPHQLGSLRPTRALVTAAAAAAATAACHTVRVQPRRQVRVNQCARLTARLKRVPSEPTCLERALKLTHQSLR